MARIVIIDDDVAMDILRQRLHYVGPNVCRYDSFASALEHIDELLSADIIILDIIMPFPETSSASPVVGTGNAGMEVLRTLRARCADLPVLVYSAIQDNAIQDALQSDEHITFIPKWNSPSLRDLVAAIHSVLKLPVRLPPPQPFIVHGRNDTVKLALKNYLQNTLKLPEPTILHEQPNMGRTIMEKFEDCAHESSLAFILLTPDDIGAAVTEHNDLKRRSRQNVIYEMGYFHGYYGRHSGRVILLYQGPLDLPSDLAGVVYIDISNGIESAGEAIRKEIAHVISSTT